MDGFYQHDIIYRVYKPQIINFILNHKDHYITTDGILSGDGKCERFYMYDIITTPQYFIKTYDVVMHLRLEDYVTYNFFLPMDRIIRLLDKLVKRGELQHSLVIVCNKLKTSFEFDFYNNITLFLRENKIEVVLENNDVLTDYYIMKESRTLICSNNTLSWVAALLSDKINKCYFPDYETEGDQTFKYPIENTELY